MPSSHLRAAIREFTSNLLNPYDPQELLQRLTEQAILIADAQGAGIMLTGRDGDLGFAAASDERVVSIEVLQDRVETGACHEAFTSNRLVAIDDLNTTDRWPEYRERALAIGFGSVLGVPMNACGQTIGVLNVYRQHPGPWREETIESAEILTAMGAAYVLHADQLRAQHRLADQLQTALQSRDIIGQAKGLLMARHDVDADAAFGMLRSLSQQTNTKLRDVAAKVVETEAANAD